MAMADARAVFAELVQARSSSMLRTAYLLTGDRAAAERLLERALLSVHQHHARIDPFEVESLVRAAMVRTAVGRSGSARRRAVLALSRHEGLSDTEIACLLDYSVGTVTRDRVRAGPLSLQVPDDLGARDDWRAEVSSELAEPPRAPAAWPLVLTAVVVIALAIGVLAGLAGDPAERELPRPLTYGNEWDLQQMRNGGEPRVDLLDSQGMLHIAGGGLVPVGTFSIVVGRTPFGWVVTSGDGSYELVRRDGSRRRFAGADAGSAALSPDGGRLVTRDGIFDTATGLRVRGPWPELDKRTRFVGWGDSGPVAVTGGGSGYLLREDAESLRLEQPPYAVASESDHVLVRDSKDCDLVAALDETGRLTPVRSWCESRALSLSPDGDNVLVGGSREEPPVARHARPEGVLDVDTGGLMILPELPRLDEYDGQDLVALTWEDSETLLFAYLVDQPRVRLIRCVSSSWTCETASATKLPPRLAPHTIFSGS